MDDKPNAGEDVLIPLLLGAFLILMIMRIMWCIDIPWIIVFAPLWSPIVLIVLVSLTMEIFYKPKNKKEND
jgi:hypothetical protein